MRNLALLITSSVLRGYRKGPENPLFGMFGFAACRTVDKKSYLNSMRGNLLPSPAVTE
jgi:hypothetical protein